jgi:hypothetical protein
MSAVFAILIAQWKTLCNRRGKRRGRLWTAAVNTVWYGSWVAVALALARIMSEAENTKLLYNVLPAGLLLVMLYWQIVPLMMATTGASLEMRKLRAYPIPDAHLFWIEALLRVTSGVEMILALTGIAIGALYNPALPKWSPLGIAGFILLNLLCAIGMRDLLGRALASKRLKETGFLLFAFFATLPHLALTHRFPAASKIMHAFTGEPWWIWPWTATARLALGEASIRNVLVLLAWIAGTALLSRWQFSHALLYEARTVAARSASSPGGLVERFYRLPAAVLPDPLGILVEKEFRFLTRSSRFRLVFLMGFTFGLLVWLPLAMGNMGHRRAPSVAGRLGGPTTNIPPEAAAASKTASDTAQSSAGQTSAGQTSAGVNVASASAMPIATPAAQAATNGAPARARRVPFFSRNYLSVISLYSLLLLSECCFWNIFGFDRSAAQFYFLAPVPFRRVLIAKNLTSIFFVTTEIAAITMVCAALGLPMGVQRLSESIAVAAVVCLFLLSAGNLQSIHNARAVNPANSFRSSAAGRAQIMLFLVYPVIFSPVALAYWARGKFGTEVAFFAVLAIEGILAAAAYTIVLKSAAASAESTKEEMLVALSAADGPIAA